MVLGSDTLMAAAPLTLVWKLEFAIILFAASATTAEGIFCKAVGCVQLMEPLATV